MHCAALLVLAVVLGLSAETGGDQLTLSVLYELFSNKLDGVQLEVSLLRGELLKLSARLDELDGDTQTRPERRESGDGGMVTSKSNSSSRRIESAPGTTTVHQRDDRQSAQALKSLVYRTLSEEKAYMRQVEERVSNTLLGVSSSLETFRQMSVEAEERITQSVQTNTEDIRNTADEQLRLYGEMKEYVDGRLESTNQTLDRIQERRRHFELRLVADVERANNATLTLRSTQAELRRTMDMKFAEINTRFSKLGCQSGEIGGQGTRRTPFRQRKFVHFRPPFASRPHLVYGTKLLDVGHDENVRQVITVNSLERNGFDITLESWDVTVMYGLAIRWMACP